MVTYKQTCILLCLCVCEGSAGLPLSPPNNKHNIIQHHNVQTDTQSGSIRPVTSTSPWSPLSLTFARLCRRTNSLTLLGSISLASIPTTADVPREVVVAAVEPLLHLCCFQGCFQGLILSFLRRLNGQSEIPFTTTILTHLGVETHCLGLRTIWGDVGPSLVVRA